MKNTQYGTIIAKSTLTVIAIFFGLMLVLGGQNKTILLSGDRKPKSTDKCAFRNISRFGIQDRCSYLQFVR